MSEGMSPEQLIKQREGDVSSIYVCARGQLTLGAGIAVSADVREFFRSARPLDSSTTWARDFNKWLSVHAFHIPQAVRDFWLRWRVDETMARVSSQLGWTISTDSDADPRLLAVLDFLWWRGSFAGFPGFLAALKAGDWDLAADELVWKNPKVHTRGHTDLFMMRDDDVPDEVDLPGAGPRLDEICRRIRTNEE